MDKDRRKEIKNELKQKEEEQLLAVLPMSKDLLKGLFDYLDEKLSEGSKYPGDSLQLTETFCVKHDLDFEK